MYAICKMMRWAHLPIPGGLYAQDPTFIDNMLLIAGIENEHEVKKMEEQQSKANRNNQGPRMGSRGGRKRR